MTKYLIALSYLDKIGPLTIKKLLARLTPEQIWRASFSDLKNLGLNENYCRLIVNQKQKINPDKIIQELSVKKINYLSFFDANYPPLLKEIYNHPLVLYYLGDLRCLQDPQTNFLSVVGTRKITDYGKVCLNKLLTPLFNYNFTIISGLALGTDTFAHKLALNFKKKTIAVLGSGLDQIYPRTNESLAREILEQQGLLLSEYPPGTPPYKQNFPYRNRIIAGLSRGVLITEADIKSGAMITAKYALDQNREAMAVPGNINNNQSKGTNYLIKNGAKAITETTDILELYSLSSPVNTSTNNIEAEKLLETVNEKTVYELIKNGCKVPDQLKIKAKLDTPELNSVLTILEVKNIIKNINGEFFI